MSNFLQLYFKKSLGAKAYYSVQYLLGILMLKMYRYSCILHFMPDMNDYYIIYVCLL